MNSIVKIVDMLKSPPFWPNKDLHWTYYSEQEIIAGNASRTIPTRIMWVEGRMHLLISVIAGIGYLWNDTGLGHLLQESGVSGLPTVEHLF